MTTAVYLNELGIVCALGADLESVRSALFADTPGGVAEHADLLPGKALHLGVVTAPLAGMDSLPAALRSRNNALLLTALAQIRPAVDAAITRFGAARVGVVLAPAPRASAKASRRLRTIAGTAYCRTAFISRSRKWARQPWPSAAYWGWPARPWWYPPPAHPVPRPWPARHACCAPICATR